MLREIKKEILAHGSINSTNMSILSLNMRLKFGACLNPPLNSENYGYLESTSHKMKEYIDRIKKFLPETSGIKNTPVCVASLIIMMSRGYKIGNQQIIPTSKIFQMHSPDEGQFALFSPIKCQKMSRFTRDFRRACLTKSGIVRKELLFQ